MYVTAVSPVPNHTHNGDGVLIQFDQKGFFKTKKSNEIRVLEKYSGRPGFWGIISTRERNSDYKGTIRNKPYLVIQCLKLGFREKTGRDPRNARVEELIEFIEYKRG
jgi:hypothetical protein